MPILINDPILSTRIFIAIFIFVLLASVRRKKDPELFPLALTQELKGLSILAVVFSHAGYFLSIDHRFLFPLSIMAGVGVNLFLFLSGYGLTVSSLKTELPAGNFFKKRLLKLFTPFWIVISVFFLLDFFILRISYSWPYIIRSFFGLFPRADLFLDINSPFWYLTPLLFYYLIFPFVFSKKRPWLAAAVIYAISYFIVQFKLPVKDDILNLYKLHLLAFPLGMAFASLFFEPYYLNRFAPARLRSFLYNINRPALVKAWLDKLKKPNIFKEILRKLNRPAYYAALTALLLLIGYTAYYSGVGAEPFKEQAISLITMSAIIILFIIKKIEIRLFYIFGLYSYEIYLFHWPIMSRYDLLFRHVPGWLAITLYLGFFLCLAWALKKLNKYIFRIKFFSH